MSRCMGDRALWELREGAGRAAERAHVRECARCGARYEALLRDLRAIERLLRAAPATALRPSRTGAVSRKLALTAGVAAVLGLAMLPAWWSRPAAPPAPASSGLADVLPFLADVSTVLSAAEGSALLSSTGRGDPLLWAEASPDGEADGEAPSEPET